MVILFLNFVQAIAFPQNKKIPEENTQLVNSRSNENLVILFGLTIAGYDLSVRSFTVLSWSLAGAFPFLNLSTSFFCFVARYEGLPISPFRNCKRDRYEIIVYATKHLLLKDLSIYLLVVYNLLLHSNVNFKMSDFNNQRII